ncbi:type II restriction endonuclease [Bosea sp. AS-1]|uniref:type II restriction endonuclease n=1 Tax=Bosea sp. AS-1 TaxID=2015316 RepID=UPI000B78DECD|nr:type II restriction endonuclease [Bosea sp. AS-1]
MGDENWQAELIRHWRVDPVGTYRNWFLWDERIKNFRSIRRGIQAVVAEVRDDRFGNAYRGSSLETVLDSIAEQRQVFKGADHAFMWKPKLRIPDIYEDRDNQVAFGRFLDTCVCCSTEPEVLSAIHTIDRQGIKGLGPSAANLLYFLHPTLAPPFNTAIVRGYNALTGARVKLGRWDEYLAMRQGMLRFNSHHRSLFSNDLGAVAAFLFDIGMGRYPIPGSDGEVSSMELWRADLEQVRADSAAARKNESAAREADHTHTEIQGWLRDLGLSLGYQVWIAANDASRLYGGGKLADGCLLDLPRPLASNGAAEAIRLIDVLWLDSSTGFVAAAYEVEHTTSIYSGIVRMLDLALGMAGDTTRNFFLVAPDDRESEVRAQFGRPAFAKVADLDLRYLPYSELRQHREAITRFGTGLKGMLAIARPLTGFLPPA